MEGGWIKDGDISASSYFDYHSVGPHNARLVTYQYGIISIFSVKKN